MHPSEILEFWFKNSKPNQWFDKNNEYDNLIIRKFNKIHSYAVKGKLSKWEETPQNCLALIILIDQFSRNIYRNNNKSFEYDHISLKICKNGLNNSFLDKLENEDNKLFFILPLIHSENIDDQKLALFILHSKLKNHSNFNKINKFFKRHKEIIKLFGRFPHRNKVLKRISNDKEIAFLKTPFSSF